MATTNITTYLIIGVIIVVAIGISIALGLDPSIITSQIIGGSRKLHHFGIGGLALILILVIFASMAGLGNWNRGGLFGVGYEPFTSTTDASGNSTVSGDVNVSGSANVIGQVGIGGTTSLAGDIVHVGSGVFLGGGALASGSTYRAGIVSKGMAYSDGAKTALAGQPAGTFMITGPQLWKDGNTYKDNIFFIYWNGLDGNQYYGSIQGTPL